MSGARLICLKTLVIEQVECRRYNKDWVIFGCDQEFDGAPEWQTVILFVCDRTRFRPEAVPTAASTTKRFDLIDGQKKNRVFPGHSGNSLKRARRTNAISGSSAGQRPAVKVLGGAGHAQSLRSLSVVVLRVDRPLFG